MRRSRAACASAVLVVIAAGLASRRYPFLLPAFLGKYPGDALWALMVYCGLAFLFPAARASRLAAGALAFSCAVEVSQLYRAPWLDAIRSTTAGHLVLGSAFSWLDLVAYAAGVALGLLLDRLYSSSRSRVWRTSASSSSKR